MDVFQEFFYVSILENFLPKEQLVLILEDQVAVRDFVVDWLNQEDPNLFQILPPLSHGQIVVN